MQHQVGREEARQRAEHARRRKQEQARRGPRRNDWSDRDEEDVADGDLFENMHPAGPTPVRKSQDDPQAPPEHAFGDLALVVGVHGVKVRLLMGDAEHDARLAPHLATSPLVVGDEVLATSPIRGVLLVSGLRERRTLLARREPGRPDRMKAIAANVDVGVVVLSADQDRLRTGILDRMWIALACSEIRTVLAVNKVDECHGPESRKDLQRTLSDYRSLGIACHAVSATEGLGLDELRREISGQVAVLIGQSGVGKSSLANALDPAGARSVGAVRRDGKGCHTTSASSLRRLANETLLIDTPGVRSFGLGDVMREDVILAFPDLARRAQECAFADCQHDREPQCAVRDHAERDPELSRRLQAFCRIRDSLGDP